MTLEQALLAGGKGLDEGDGCVAGDRGSRPGFFPTCIVPWNTVQRMDRRAIADGWPGVFMPPGAKGQGLSGQAPVGKNDGPAGDAV